jgi:hypothetical protein
MRERKENTLMSEEARELDQFYTNPKISKRFVEKIDELYDLKKFDHVIEPSMGEGFIYDYLPTSNRIGLDIEKNHPDCLEGDFLEWTPEKSAIEYEPLLGQYPDIAFVGNPPFGRSSGLAIDFFEHCALYSDVVCFIIPRTWMKYSIHQRLPSDYGLYWQAILPEYAFVFNGKPYPVRCVAQCWSRYDPQPEKDIEGNEDWQGMDLTLEEPA